MSVNESPVYVLNIGYVSKGTNTDVRMYTCKFILIDVVSLLYNAGVKITIGNYTGIYTITTIHEKVS